jgi:hypothetical protein
VISVDICRREIDVKGKIEFWRKAVCWEWDRGLQMHDRGAGPSVDEGLSATDGLVAWEHGR